MRTTPDLFATTPGCWTGALVSDGGASTPFAFRQPGVRAAARLDGAGPALPSLSLSGAPGHPARVLESAARSFVALVEAAPDRLLLEARIRGDRLVGRWLRRDATGAVIDRGDLTAERGAASI